MRKSCSHTLTSCNRHLQNSLLLHGIVPSNPRHNQYPSRYRLVKNPNRSCFLKVGCLINRFTGSRTVFAIYLLVGVPPSQNMGSCPSYTTSHTTSHTTLHTTKHDTKSPIIKKLESILRTHNISNLSSCRVRRNTILHYNNEVFVKSLLSDSIHDAKKLKKKMIALTDHDDVCVKRRKILRHNDIVITVFKNYTYDLHHAIHSVNVHPEHLQIYLYSLVTNIHHLHARKMAHTDLKPSNVLCDFNRLTTRLCDLENSYISDHSFVYKGGSLFYKPSRFKLKCLLGRDCSTLRKMQLLDLYALGCIIRQSLLALTTHRKFWKNLGHYYCETCLQPSFTRGKAGDICHIASYHSVKLPVWCCQ